MALIKAVQRAFSKMAPTSLAETWDNTGLLLESPVVRPSANKVLLTIDLSPGVAEEALTKHPNVGVIVTYHPIIFRGLKALSLGDPLQNILLRCAAAGISLDSVVGGINDHLCEVVAGQSHRSNSKVYSVSGALIENSGDQLCGVGVGGGRRVEFEKGEEVGLDGLLDRIKAGLKLSHVQLAKSRSAPPLIRSVGVCAGSGGSICSQLGTSCDAFLTGEMSHHEILSATASGTHVILTSHTNTERFFLSKVLKARLQELLVQEQRELLTADTLTPEEWEVVVSMEDRDPVEIV